MPWDDIARGDYARPGLRSASDRTDREWEVVAPFLPPPRRIGRPRSADLREVVNAVLYMAATGCQWRMLPKDLPPHLTVQRYFYDWRDSGLWRTISNSLVKAARELDGREASPSAGVTDTRLGAWTIEIVKRSDTAGGFEVLLRRWVVERTFAWLGRCRRLAKDREASVASAEAWIFVAHIRLLTKRLARFCHVS
jgi:transposase